MNISIHNSDNIPVELTTVTYQLLLMAKSNVDDTTLGTKLTSSLGPAPHLHQKQNRLRTLAQTILTPQCGRPCAFLVGRLWPRNSFAIYRPIVPFLCTRIQLQTNSDFMRPESFSATHWSTTYKVVGLLHEYPNYWRHSISWFNPTHEGLLVYLRQDRNPTWLWAPGNANS